MSKKGGHAPDLSLPDEEDGGVFRALHFQTVAQAAAGPNAVMREACDTSRTTQNPWIGFDCVWTGRGQPLQALPISTSFTAAVLRFSAVGGQLPPEWHRLLGAPHIRKASSSVPIVDAGLRGLDAVFDGAYDPSLVAWVGTPMGTGTHSLSDVILALHALFFPPARDLRSLSWGGELN